MKTIRKNLLLRPYPAKGLLVLAKDIHAERKKHDKRFGPGPEDTDWAACHSSSGSGDFGLFFDYRWLSHRIVAHEVLHMTHRVLAHSAVKFDIDNHEAFAYLVGEITDQVYLHIGRWVKK